MKLEYFKKSWLRIQIKYKQNKFKRVDRKLEKYSDKEERLALNIHQLKFLEKVSFVEKPIIPEWLDEYLKEANKKAREKHVIEPEDLIFDDFIDYPGIIFKELRYIVINEIPIYKKPMKCFFYIKNNEKLIRKAIKYGYVIKENKK